MSKRLDSARGRDEVGDTLRLVGPNAQAFPWAPGPLRLPSQAQNGDALRQLVAQHRLVAVYGPPGVGKSQCLQSFAQSLGGDCLYLDTHSVDALSPLLTLLAMRLEIHLDDRHSQGQMRVLAQALESGPWKAVVADGEALAPEIFTFWQGILEFTPSLTLILGTRALPIQPIKALEIRPLDGSESRALYRHFLGQSADEAVDFSSLDPLMDALDGLPLALELAADLEPVFSPQQLAERLKADLSPLEGPQGSLRGALLQSWQALDGELQALARQLARFPHAFSVEMAEAYCDASKLPIWKGIQQLLRHGFLTTVDPFDGIRRCRILNAVRIFIAQQPEGNQPLPEAIRRRWAQRFRYLIQQWTHLHDRQMRLQVQEEIPLAVAYLRQSGPGDIGYLEATTLLGYGVIFNGRHREDFLRAFEGIRAAHDDVWPADTGSDREKMAPMPDKTKTPSKNPATPGNNSAHAAKKVSSDPLYPGDGWYRLALALQYILLLGPKRHGGWILEQLEAVEVEARTQHYWDLLAQALRIRGHSHGADYQDEKARAALEAAVRQGRRCNNPAVLVKALESLGWFYGHTQRSEAALELFREALAICEGVDDSHRASTLHVQLARNLGQSGCFKAARSHLAAALSGGIYAPKTEALCLEIESLLLLREGKEAEALEPLKRSIAAHRCIENQRAVAGWSRLMGALYGGLGAWEQSQSSLLEALWIYENMGAQDDKARVLALLAGVCQVLGDEAEAEAYEKRFFYDENPPAEASRLMAYLRAWRGGLPASADTGAAVAEEPGAEAAVADEMGAAGAWQLLGQGDALPPKAFDTAEAAVKKALLQTPEAQWPRWILAFARWRQKSDGGQRGQGAPAAPTFDFERGTFKLPGDEVVIDLSRRAPMRRILEGLVTLAEQDPQAKLSIWDAYELGWPGEEVAYEQMVHRVRVVISRLRKLGLKNHIQTLPQGYRYGLPKDESSPKP